MTFTLERIVLAALALVGAGAVIMARGYGDGTGHGGNLVPILAGGLMTLLSSAALIGTRAGEKASSTTLSWRPLMVLLGTAVFLALMPIVGYPVATPIWIAANMYVLGSRSPASIIATALSLPIIAYLLLAKVAYAPPPMGPFGG